MRRCPSTVVLKPSRIMAAEEVVAALMAMILRV